MRHMPKVEREIPLEGISEDINPDRLLLGGGRETVGKRVLCQFSSGMEAKLFH